jgi:protein-tyrosine phosphatase
VARRSYTPGVDVLVLCTANLCRSPTAEVLLARRFAEHGVEAHVHSAGRHPGGHGSPEPALHAFGTLGVDLREHRSRTLTREMLAEADLVIAMAREHVRDAVALDPDVWSRTFTLKELVRRGEAAGRRSPSEELSAWLRRVEAGRSASALLGSARADDVADPIGGPTRGYRRMVREVDALAGRLAALLA